MGSQGLALQLVTYLLFETVSEPCIDCGAIQR